MGGENSVGGRFGTSPGAWSALSRLARTQPAEPAPTLTNSRANQGQASRTRLHGVCAARRKREKPDHPLGVHFVRHVAVVSSGLQSRTRKAAPNSTDHRAMAPIASARRSSLRMRAMSGATGRPSKNGAQRMRERGARKHGAGVPLSAPAAAGWGDVCPVSPGVSARSAFGGAPVQQSIATPARQPCLEPRADPAESAGGASGAAQGCPRRWCPQVVPGFGNSVISS